MKLSDYFAHTGGLAPQLAEVTVLREGRLITQGQDDTEGMPIFAPCGVSYLPTEGERVLLLPFEDYYVCVGALCRTEGLTAGELLLKSAGGARILLKNNGEILLNNLRISPDGQILQSEGA